MPEPFKNLYNLTLIDSMSGVLHNVSPSFDASNFKKIATNGLADLEMMARAEQISHALEQGLSGNFLENLNVLKAALHSNKTSELSDMRTDAVGIAGWAIVPLASYVARCGMDAPQQSLDALREMTKRFSTEFAVRFFLRDHPDISIDNARKWATDDNFHVRRLASEGLRPLLPWGIKLHQFVDDPQPLLPILTQLRDDPSEYVRKSVANNLNDISKDHPDLIANLAKEWMKDAPQTRIKLVRHACRSLIKAGHGKTLEAFGFGAPDISNVQLVIPKQVNLGDPMPIKFTFTAQQNQAYLIDYVLHFMRANGKLSPKVFKWTEISVVSGQSKTLEKIHPYKQVTTRKDYPGTQVLAVQVNGIEVARHTFEFGL